MKRFFIFALVATLFAACSTDATQDLAPEMPTSPDELYVSFDEEDTRIQLGENGAPVWTAGDLVSVFYRSNANDKYQFRGHTGDTQGSITLVESGTATVATTRVVAVYPYSDSYWYNWETHDVEAFLPTEQTYLKDSYGVNSSIMISSSNYKQLSFKNVCGWLKLQFTGRRSVSKIVLRGNCGEQVAGEIYINSADASCVLASAMGESGDGTGGNIAVDGTVLTSVTLNCGNGVALNSETPTAFYIALPPQTFTQGITIDVLWTDGLTMTKSTTNSLTIERNHILPMASIELKMPTPLPSPPYNLVHSSLYVQSTGNGLAVQALPNYEPILPTSSLMTFEMSPIDLDKAFNIIDGNGNILTEEQIAAVGLVAEFELEQTYNFSAYNEGKDPEQQRWIQWTWDYNGNKSNKLNYHANVAEVPITCNLYIQNSNGSRTRLTTNFDTDNAYQNFVVRGYNPISSASVVNCLYAINAATRYRLNVLDYVIVYDYRNGYTTYPLIKNGSWVVGDGSNGFAMGRDVRDIYGINTYIGSPSIPSALSAKVGLSNGYLIVDNSGSSVATYLRENGNVSLRIPVTISTAWGDQIVYVPITLAFF